VILLIAFDETAVGTPDFGSSCSRTSFEPHPGEIPASRQLVRKPDGKADGKHIESQPPGPQTLRITAASRWRLNQAHTRSMIDRTDRRFWRS
jgi:hypothetical protein